MADLKSLLNKITKGSGETGKESGNVVSNLLGVKPSEFNPAKAKFPIIPEPRAPKPPLPNLAEINRQKLDEVQLQASLLPRTDAEGNVLLDMSQVEALSPEQLRRKVSIQEEQTRLSNLETERLRQEKEEADKSPFKKLIEDPKFSKVAGGLLLSKFSPGAPAAGLSVLGTETGQEFAAGAATSIPLAGELFKPSAQTVREQSTLPSATVDLPLIGETTLDPMAAGALTGNIGFTAAQYGAVNKALEGLGATSKLGQLLGTSKPAKFVATQGVDLLADVIVQTPAEALDAIVNDDSLGDFAKTWAVNRGVDVLMNLAIGGTMSAVQARKAKAAIQSDAELKQAAENAVSKINDPVAKKTIQEELGLEAGIDSSALINDFENWSRRNFPQLGATITESELSTLKNIYKRDVGIDIDQIIKDATPPQVANKVSEILNGKVADMKIDDTLKQVDDLRIRDLQDGPTTVSDLRFDDINKGFKTTVELDDATDRAFNKLLNKGYNVPEAELVQNVTKNFKNYKDVGSMERFTTDPYRIYEKVFGDSADQVKSVTLDKLDSAKKLRIEEEITLADDLKKNIVDRFGFKKGSKESALIQRYGEGNIDTEGLIKLVGEEKANNIVQADAWFRDKYNRLIDDINDSRVVIGKDPIPKLDNYYRHFNEISGLQGVKDLFTANKQISPQLAGISDFTKPGEKWASFKQSRKGGKFKEDAIGGFIDYVPAATYAKHIDPEIARLRSFENELRRAVGENTSINNFLEFMNDYSNALAGKTNPFDRMTQKVIGRKAFGIINKLNSRMKANAVLGNASSSLAQIANVPQMLAFVKNPKQIAGGLDGYFKSLAGGGDKALYEQSGFIKERVTDAMKQFDTKIMDQPKNFAKWMLGALDETGTKFIWSSTYRKALADGVQNPIKYADDITRKLVAGRGIGEVPISQQSKLFQLVAPFTLEVNNLWKIQKDFLKKKDFAALAILYGANYILNDAMEGVRGSRVTFDPINAIMEGVAEGEGVGDKILKGFGSLAGEVLGNIPLGQSAATIYPEFGGEFFGVKLPTREQLFGENDPTRFGTGLPIVNAIQKPISSLLFPFGGQQLRKTFEGAQALGIVPQLTTKGLKFDPNARNKRGNIITPVESDLMSLTKGLIFGKYAIPEVKSVYESDGRALSDKGTANFEKLTSEGFEPQQLFKAITEAKVSRKKAEIANVLEKYYNDDEVDKILIDFYGFKGR